MAVYTITSDYTFGLLGLYVNAGDTIEFSESLIGEQISHYSVYSYVPAGVTMNGLAGVVFALTSPTTYDNSAYFYVYGTFNTNGMEITRSYLDNTIVVGGGGLYNQTGTTTTYEDSGPKIWLDPGASASFTNTNAHQVIVSSSDALTTNLVLKNSTIYDLNIAGDYTNYSAIIENCLFNTVILNNNEFDNDVLVKNITVNSDIAVGCGVIIDGLTIRKDAVLKVNSLPQLYENFSNLEFQSEIHISNSGGLFSRGIPGRPKRFTMYLNIILTI